VVDEPDTFDVDVGDCDVLSPQTTEQLAASFTALFQPCVDLIEPDESYFF